MGAGIFHIRDGKLTELSESPFETEDIFQELLSSHPGLIAGDQINRAHPRRWLLIRREAGIPDDKAVADRWSVDHLFVDQEGIPTLVEVKRSSDTRLRREVVGQMLDYAANAVVYWPPGNIKEQFDLRCQRDGLDPDSELAVLLGDSSDPEDFWGLVKTNLQAGKVRMLFVADVIPDELRRIVEFLNTQMDPAEVLALEIRRYTDGTNQTLVPRVIGQTAEAETKKASAGARGKLWDEAAFFAALGSDAPASAEAARAIYDWACKQAEISWGRGAKNGAFHVAHEAGRPKLFYVYSSGHLQFSPRSWRDIPPFDAEHGIAEFIDRLERVEGLTNGKSSGWEHSWVDYQLADLADAAAAQELVQVLDWAFSRIRDYEAVT